MVLILKTSHHGPSDAVHNPPSYSVFANERRHSEQPESINDTYVLEKDDSNFTPDSSNICNNDNQHDKNVNLPSFFVPSPHRSSFEKHASS
ncbi:hypothetical protein Tco_1532614 [Tanacetum coccineum]